ncbi:MAG: DUF952 domain-containing protein [Hyphomicrobiales bacterium]|nr:DUF952 domain-containing protein [Hyphomicrobiales bacterium]
MQTIYKVCTAVEWAAAVEAGAYTGSEPDKRDGFIHFSTAAQAQATAEKHFARQSELVLVAVDANALGDALKWEPSRDGDLFPHLYADLPVSTVTGVTHLPLGADGRHIFPDKLAVDYK